MSEQTWEPDVCPQAHTPECAFRVLGCGVRVALSRCPPAVSRASLLLALVKCSRLASRPPASFLLLPSHSRGHTLHSKTCPASLLFALIVPVLLARHLICVLIQNCQPPPVVGSRPSRASSRPQGPSWSGPGRASNLVSAGFNSLYHVSNWTVGRSLPPGPLSPQSCFWNAFLSTCLCPHLLKAQVK